MSCIASSLSRILHRPYVLAVLAGACVVTWNVPAPAARTSAVSGKTIGLAISIWDSAIFETADAKQECPDGLQFSEKDQWSSLSEEERKRLNKLYGFRWNRGPNGENGITAPNAIEDPLPFREVQSKVAFGFNLDGSSEDRATSQKTCAHKNFSSPEGETGIDHQMYRVVGCAQGMRKGGFQREWVGKEIETQPANRMLIQIAGVDDERNDADVWVTFYKGFDGLPSDSVGKFLSGATHRVDNRFPPLFTVKGKIDGGVLTTDPLAVASFPIKWIQIVGTRNVLDMRMRFELTTTGAKGLIGGYENIQEHWNMWRRGASGSQDISSWSGASIYKAMRRLADGYPDPRTGQCTAISVAYRVEAVRANIVFPSSEMAREDVTLAADRELRGY